MNNVIKIFALACAILGFASCQVDHSYEDDTYPELSYYQIVGTWRLAQWNGEDMLSGERYVYMELEGRERTFNLYQNIESARPRHLSGTFELFYDEGAGQNLVSGLYDHEFGFWNNDYVVTLTDDDTMVWTVASDDSDVSVYIRSELPDELKQL